MILVKKPNYELIYHYKLIDTVYDSYFINKFINIFTKGGKKDFIAKKIYNIFYKINKVVGSPLVVFFETLELFKPAVELITVRRGRNFYKIPTRIKSNRQYLLALKLLKAQVLSKEGYNLGFPKFEDRLFNVFSDFFVFRGEILPKIPKFKEIEFQSMENIALSHFRWK